MSEPNGPDPLDRLRVADPMRADDVPSASLARVSARIQEHIMADDRTRTATRRSPRTIVLGGAVAAAGALVLAVALGLGGGSKAPGPVAVVPSSNPTVAPSVAPSQHPSGAPSVGPKTGGGGVASCIRYDPSLLSNFDSVFDGTVTAVDGQQVTFNVTKAWKGSTGSVTLTNPPGTIGITGPAPTFDVGARYLVSASAGNIASCGYSLPYDATTAASWAAAFGG